MTQATEELPQASWRGYFDELSRDLGAVEATVEVDDPDLGALIEADEMLLTGITYDDRDNLIVIGLDAPGGSPEELEHLVWSPERIFVDAPVGMPSAIAIEDEVGRRTLIRLEEAPELPAE